MNVYLQLFATAMISSVASLILYLLDRKTPLGKLPYAVKQLLIGIIFGGIAVLGTEYGVVFSGATINARDAAPLCAGLIFGGPAGIIAGTIGAVERWFAVYWGAGMYSRFACTVATFLAGIYAALLRRYMFDNKRPVAGFGFVTAIVMEVVHLSILFLSHLSDSANAYQIVKGAALPMIVCNAVSVGCALLFIGLCTEKRKHIRRRSHLAEQADPQPYTPVKTIAERVQTWMLVAVVFGYVITTVFVYILQTNTAISEAESLLSLNVSDVKADISDRLDTSLLSTAQDIAAQYQADPSVPLERLLDLFDVTEINISDENGIITSTTHPDYLGYDFASAEQSASFLCLLDGEKTYIQQFTAVGFDPDDESRSRKYAGVALENGGFLQVGIDREKLHSHIAEAVQGLTHNRHIGEQGFVFIANEKGIILSGEASLNNVSLSYAGIKITGATPENTRLESTIYSKDSYWMYTSTEGYSIVAVYPTAEVFASRDAAAYINSFMEVIVFAILFALIYSLIKKLVVNNIRSVNKKLEQISGGDLNVTVDVRSSTEFSSLSDDINSTVTTLKRYIDEAAARIDKELEFARNIQSSALPSVFPAFPDEKAYDLYATMNTAKEVGGDFYDFYRLGEDKLAFLIADVSGKGIPAAMFMMRAKTMLKNLALEGLPVNEILTRANAGLCEGNDAGMFVTAWMGILDKNTGHIEFANAGHNPPLVRRSDGKYEYLKSKAGLVLAGMEGIRYRAQSLDLAPGERIYLYTDGVTEATDLAHELYGEERLLRFLNSRPDNTPRMTLLSIKADIDRFVGEAEQFDDITMLVVDYLGNEENKMAEKVFPAKIEEYDNANAFLEEELENADFGMKAIMQIAIAFEEMFVNVAHYAYPDGDGTVTVGVSVEDGVATIRLIDSGVPFDPLAKADPDITLEAEDRQIGGLGIFMVKKTMDSVAYEYTDGKNIFTMTKKQ